MSVLRTLSLLFLAICCAKAEDISGAWTYLPAETESEQSTYRIVIRSAKEIENQTLSNGLRRTEVFPAKISKDKVEVTDSDGQTVIFLKQVDSLILQKSSTKEETQYKQSKEWDKRFEDAPVFPSNRIEALAALRILLGADELNALRSMKKTDLISLHLGLGMSIRNMFELWSNESPLLADLGGGHPDGASNRLIELLWEDLQNDKQIKKPTGKKQ